MKKLRYLFFSLLLTSACLQQTEEKVQDGSVSLAQIIKPVKWTYSVDQKDENNTTLHLTAAIEKGFHMYAMEWDPNAIPIPTSFTFKVNKNYSLSGKTEQDKPLEEFDSLLNDRFQFFYNKADFRQKISIKSKERFTIKGSLTYQVCDENSCLPPDDVDFSFVINPDAKTSEKVEPVNAKTPGDTTSMVSPVENNIVVADTAAIVPSYNSNLKLETGCGMDSEGQIAEDKSFVGIFIAGMLGGLLALLTPCVFPMIPLTVSFFTKRSGSRKKSIANAIIYASSIIVIYVVLGLLVTVIFGSDALNDFATNGFFNMLFFAIFLIFAISFFGAFEITLPSAFINKADQASDRGGLIGIFFMAFTLSLVSFSCTGPIIGTLLVEAAQGSSYVGPIAGMFGFSFALAVPFALFALFPGWLNSLPKSGSWLNTVKVCLGFLELALAFKFLSNVDLAYHWNFLYREIFIVIWIIIFTLMGFYLLGKIRFAHDSEVSHVSVGRLLFAILTFVFALYLVPGIWGAPLKLISGLPPPEYYKEWKSSKSNGDCPHDLACFHDFDEGMRYARAQGKPVIIDFTGYNCQNCRRMEELVWSDTKVLGRLSDNFVLISLYVDDKEALPESKRFYSKELGKEVKTVGTKWQHLEASAFGKVSQPWYVMLDNKGKVLAKPVGYTPDIKDYVTYLDEGLCRYEKRKSDDKNLAAK